MGALTCTVYVHDLPPGEDKAVFTPGEDVPEWAARQMGAHCFAGGEHPYAPAGPPPKTGVGSSKPFWATYAAEQGVDVAEDASRDAILTALVKAGKPVERK